MDIFKIAEEGSVISDEEIAKLLELALMDWESRRGAVKNALVIPPDFTRFHSNAGFITQVFYRLLTAKGANVDILPALGTHVPVSESQWKTMFGDIPYGKMLVHNWRTDVVRLGEVPAAEVERISEGLWKDPVSVEVNRRLMDDKYDLIVSPGQVVPHEVIGMANHAKNIFVGIGGSDMINKSHMIGAVCGMEKAMGRDHTPVRQLFDYAFDHYVAHRQHGLRKCVVYLDPSEFSSTWLGNKAIYRTRMAMADGGELIVLAPGVKQFGEDKAVDGLIRKYGYRGRLHTLEVFKRPDADDLRANMGAAAHLIHGSSDGRFSITYCVKEISREEVEGVGFKAASYDEMSAKYDPAKLKYGYNVVDGEEIYFIPNPALGLWINREKFNEQKGA